MATPPPGMVPPMAPPTESWKDKIGSGLGNMEQIYLAEGGVNMPFDKTPLGQSLIRHQQRRMSEAAMHYNSAITAAETVKSGIDPATQQPLTPERRQQLMDQFEASYGAYAKMVGTDKESKAKLAQGKNIIDYMISQQYGSPQQAQHPASGAAAASPTGSTAAAPPPQTPNVGGIPTPPPGMSPADVQAMNELGAPYEQQQINMGLEKQLYDIREGPTIAWHEAELGLQQARDAATEKYRAAQVASTNADRAARLALAAQNQQDREKYQQEELSFRKQAQQDADAYRKAELDVQKLRAQIAANKKTGTSPAFTEYKNLESELGRVQLAKANAVSKQNPIPFLRGDLSNFDRQENDIKQKMAQILQANPALAEQIGAGSQGTPGGAASPAPKTATMSQVREYAMKYKMTVAKARKMFEDDGIKVTP